RTAKFLNAVFAPHLAAWLQFVEQRADSLLRDLADGHVAAGLALPREQRAALDALLRADPARSAELERAFAAAPDRWVRPAGPPLPYPPPALPAPSAPALPRLPRRLGALPIHTTCLSASEGMLGLNLELGRPDRYVLCNGAACFEFIPLDRAGQDQPP